MTYTFPPDPRPLWLVVTAHAALAVLLLGSVLLFVRQARRAPLLSGIAFWVGAVVTAWVLALSLFFGQFDSLVALVIALAVSFIAAIAMFVTTWRLAMPGNVTDRLAAIVCPIGVLFFVLWLLTPGLGEPPEAIHRRQCRDNLRAIGRQLHDVLDKTGSFPPAIVQMPAPRSWRVDLLPWIKNAPLRSRYNDAAAWDNLQNEPVAQQPPDLYVCRSNFNPADAHGRRYTAYAAVTGSRSIFENGTSRQPAAITDGLSNTILVVEACGQEIVWTEPRDVDISRSPARINLGGSTRTHSPGIGSSYHHGGSQVLMADGTARFLSERIDPRVLKAISTAAGGETVDDF